MLRFLCVAMVLVASSRAMMLCPENACASMQCDSMEGCEGRVNEAGGWCGCCDICMTQLGLGDECIQTLLLGTPATAECGQGLQCSFDSEKCEQKEKNESEDEADMGLCLRRLEEIRNGKANGMPLIGVMEPVCDADGSFNAVQCIGSVCDCTDSEGNTIDGYSTEIGLIADMNCECARDQAAYMKTGLIGKLFYCAANGNYRQSTPTPDPTRQPILAVTQTVGLTGSEITGVCAIALASAETSSLLGRFIPECDADGMYTPRQCQGSECYCVRKDGTKIAGYSAPIAQKDHVTCQCARDKDRYDSMGLLGRIHTCRANGNYQQYQCVGSVCHCTDDVGAIIGDQSVSIANINDLKC